MKHYKTISDYRECRGMSSPLHPLICIDRDEYDGENDSCHSGLEAFSTEFYSITMKKIVSGRLAYGHTDYDFRSGVLMFLKPEVVCEIEDLRYKSSSIHLLFHKDFIQGSHLESQIARYGFFSYTLKEALHLSEREEQTLWRIFENIETEYNQNIDEFSQEIIISQIEALLKYANRFYKRQFLGRKLINKTYAEKFKESLDEYFDKHKPEIDGTPRIDDMAEQMKLSPRYLSDLLKQETGKTAIEHINLYLVDRAKEIILESDDSISEVAYSLGFEYPQYFSRMFKKAVGESPKAFRENNVVKVDFS
jgi:AraC-like DNA-binding protein